MRWSRFSLVIVFTIGFGVAERSSAQTPSAWSADATVGGGTGHGSGYSDEGSFAARLALSGRVLQRQNLAVYFEGGYDWLGFGGTLVLCATGSGGCGPAFPHIEGLSGSAGLAVAPWTRVEARAGVGAAAYAVDGTLLGSMVGQLDAAVFPATHVGLVVGTRLVVIPRYRRDRLTIVPVLFGLRLR